MQVIVHSLPSPQLRIVGLGIPALPLIIVNYVTFLSGRVAVLLSIIILVILLAVVLEFRGIYIEVED